MFEQRVQARTRIGERHDRPEIEPDWPAAIDLREISAVSVGETQAVRGEFDIEIKIDAGRIQQQASRPLMAPCGEGKWRAAMAKHQSVAGHFESGHLAFDQPAASDKIRDQPTLEEAAHMRHFPWINRPVNPALEFKGPAVGIAKTTSDPSEAVWW